MGFRRYWLAGGLFLASSLLHAELVLRGPPATPDLGGGVVAAALRRGDTVGLAIGAVALLGVVGGIVTVAGWSYAFSSGSLAATLVYYLFLAPLALPYLPLLAANAAAWALVVIGRREFADQRTGGPAGGSRLTRRRRSS